MTETRAAPRPHRTRLFFMGRRVSVMGCRIELWRAPVLQEGKEKE